jgi:hypothetical protein
MKSQINFLKPKVQPPVCTSFVRGWWLAMGLGFCLASTVLSGTFLAFLVVFEQRLSVAKLVSCMGVLFR